MDLAGADAAFILAETQAGKSTALASESADGHEVVAKARLGLVSDEIRHRLDDSSVIAGRQPVDAELVSRAGFLCSDIYRVPLHVIAELSQWPKNVGKTARGEDQ